MRTESSGGSYADSSTQIYQQLQQVYGDPSSVLLADSRPTRISPARCKASPPTPRIMPRQTGVISGRYRARRPAQQSLSSTVQTLRSSCEQGLSDSVTNANNLLQNIADINSEVAGLPSADRDDRIVARSARRGHRPACQPDGHSASFPAAATRSASSPRQACSLPAPRPRPCRLIRAARSAANSLWNANPALSGAGTITLTSPDGGTTDLVATNAIKSGQIGAYLQMRDTISAAGAIAARSDRRFDVERAVGLPDHRYRRSRRAANPAISIDVGNLLAGNSVTVSYTASPGNTPHTLTIENVSDPSALPLPSPDPNNPVVGVDFSGDMAGAVRQLNGILNSKLQFSNPSGTTLAGAQWRLRHRDHHQFGYVDRNPDQPFGRHQPAAVLHRRLHAVLRAVIERWLADRWAMRAASTSIRRSSPIRPISSPISRAPRAAIRRGRTFWPTSSPPRA